MEMYKAEADAFNQEVYQRFGKLEQRMNRQGVSISQLESDIAELKVDYKQLKEDNKQLKADSKDIKNTLSLILEKVS